MERQSSKGENLDSREMMWELLDDKEKMVYVEQAEYLISKGYLVGDPFVIAKSLYMKRKY